MKFLILVLCAAVVAADPHWKMLDHDEVEVVKKTWNEVKNKETEILAAIFKEHPDIQNKFPMFAGKSLDQLKSSQPFSLHATRIVSFITQYISLLGHDETQPAVKTILNEMGQNHRNRGVTKQQLEEFGSSLMKFMKEHSSWNDKAEHAWHDAMDKMYFVIFSSLDGHPVQ
ncbi:hypothetical protein PVAND_007705 [Polypedilum vanderplanki]|uniref:Globin n=1 Tax=Polypedilum vanderplanki TaxID=319348 RepID=S6BEI9_POLVA|nr:hypothetical protein PVAND_007705 [Polypedilum vanderplanki]BAN67576.1 globin [Polypedilum vanderplanki]